MVASDGGIFTFGDAGFYGSTGGQPLEQPDRRAWRRRPPATATGWSPPTAASSPSATPPFYGSTGGQHAQPADRRHGRDADRQRLLARRLRRRHLRLRRRRVLRLDRRPAAQQADRRHGRDADRPRLLAGRLRRRHLRLRRRRLLRLDRRPSPNKPIVGMAATPTGHGYWLRRLRRRHLHLRRRRRSTARPAASRSTSRSSAWPRPPTGNGYWLVASDGGIFTFGDANFYGSMGGQLPRQADRGHGRPVGSHAARHRLGTPAGPNRPKIADARPPLTSPRPDPCGGRE